MLKRLLIAAMTIAPSFSAMADGPKPVDQLISENHCLSCHAIDDKKIGPAFAWIAYRYHGQKGADDKLANKIIHGGSGNWDAWTYSTPMPPNHELTHAQAEAMAKWILAQKPARPPDPQ
jgi:cytochrome c